MQVCSAAGVPLHTVPLTDQYWDRVVSHSIAEIKAGRTPNPDILCNSRSAPWVQLFWCSVAEVHTAGNSWHCTRGLLAPMYAYILHPLILNI